MHSELPPSSSDKWLVCSGWRRLNQTIPRKPSGAAAQEGTEAHEMLAKAVQKGLVPDEVKDSVLSDAISMVLDYIQTPGVEVHSEVSLDFGEKFGYVGLTGTADLVLVHQDYLHLIDFKYGRQPVEVQDNPQLLTYLVGAAHKFGTRPAYQITIIQPRDRHFAGPIRSQELGQPDLLEFESRLLSAIQASYTKPEFKTGPHCKNYCEAISVCPAARALVVKLFGAIDD